jgi:hypothetical protein
VFDEWYWELSRKPLRSDSRSRSPAKERCVTSETSQDNEPGKPEDIKPRPCHPLHGCLVGYYPDFKLELGTTRRKKVHNST